MTLSPTFQTSKLQFVKIFSHLKKVLSKYFPAFDKKIVENGKIPIKFQPHPIYLGDNQPGCATGCLRSNGGFLKDILIIEPVGITQELLHTIKTKYMKVVVLKLDLVKAFD